MKTEPAGRLVFILTGLMMIIAMACEEEDELLHGTFTDERDGQRYKTITIGSQTWMAENLKYMPSVAGLDSGWISGRIKAVPFYFVYGYDGTIPEEARATENYRKYGVLYNWYAADSACPCGWHLPSDGEWNVLRDFVFAGINDHSIGRALKSSEGWKYYGNGTNRYGFSALPAGHRSPFYEFSHLGEVTFFWSSTVYSKYSAFSHMMVYDYQGLYQNENNMDLGYSVRCIKDE